MHHPDLVRYWHGFGRPGERAVLARTAADGPALGLAWLRIWTRACHGYGFVDPAIPELSIAILPKWRGQGIGTLLIESLVVEARRAGHPGISLSVQRTNPAIRLYLRLGWREVGPDGEDAVLLKSWAAGLDSAAPVS